MVNSGSPIGLFSLFWDVQVFEQLERHSNLYVKLKLKSGDGRVPDGGSPESPGKRMRSWKDSISHQLKVSIEITIKMGLHKETALALY